MNDINLNPILHKYEVFLFDADETLFDFRASENIAILTALKNFNLPFDIKTIQTYVKINNDIWHEFESRKVTMTQEKLKYERFNRFVKIIGANCNYMDLAKSYMYALSQASIPYDFTISLLEKLTSFNKRICIVSNGLKEVQDGRIRKSKFGKYFETVSISDELGVSKPDPEIFVKTLENINYTDKSKVLMIGDKLISDILGGINFGIDTLWYNIRKEDACLDKSGNPIIPTYITTDLYSYMFK